jgi:prolipoprotein diacylglyceryltransferase
MGRYEAILVVAVVLVLLLGRQLANGAKEAKDQPQEASFFFLGLVVLLGSILIFVLLWALKHAA